jgi:hypothetical protein
MHYAKSSLKFWKNLSFCAISETKLKKSSLSFKKKLSKACKLHLSQVGFNINQILLSLCLFFFVLALIFPNLGSELMLVKRRMLNVTKLKHISTHLFIVHINLWIFFMNIYCNIAIISNPTSSFTLEIYVCQSGHVG